MEGIDRSASLYCVLLWALRVLLTIAKIVYKARKFLQARGYTARRLGFPDEGVVAVQRMG